MTTEPDDDGDLDLVEMGDGVLGLDVDGTLGILLHWVEGIVVDPEGMPVAATPAGICWIDARRLLRVDAMAVETQDPTPDQWQQAARIALDAFVYEELVVTDAVGRRPVDAPDPGTDEELERWGAPLREVIMMIGGIEGTLTSPVTGLEYAVSLERWAGQDLDRTFVHLAFKNTDHGPGESP